MTLTITADWLVYLYWLVEHYVCVRVLDIKVKSYYDYFEEVAYLEDCRKSNSIQQVELPIVSTEAETIQLVEKPVVAKQTPLGSAVEDLWSELQQELGLNEVTNELSHSESENHEVEWDYEMVMFDDCEEQEETLPPIFLVEDEVEEQDDCIYMADLVSEVEPITPVGYEEYASAKIADCIDGPQQWVVSVIGLEDQYVHVSDGKRVWVNIGERAAKLRNRDVLILDVVRNGKEVHVENLLRLEASPSTDYTIPDEEHYFFENESIAI